MTERVLQVAPSYPPVVGGIEDHVANLVDRLPEHGYDPVVLTPDRKGMGSDPPIYRPSTRLRIMKSAFAPGILRYLRSLEYDLIHVHAPFHFGLGFATLAAKLRSVPLVITVHMYDARDSLLYQLYESQVYDRCLNRADAIVPTTMDYVDGYPAFERNRERVRPVPLGVDTKHYRPVPDAREEFGWGETEQVVLFVGAMERHHFYKDVEGLIDAVAGTDDVDRLVLVGGGDRVPQLRSSVAERGLDDCVEFTGYVPDESLPNYYAGADAFVLPSKTDRGEAFGIVLMEAMACGTPVVTTDIPGVRTVVGDGGVVVDPGDTEALGDGILEVLDGTFDPRDRVLEQYSLQSVTEQLVAVYRELLSPDPRPGDEI